MPDTLPLMVPALVRRLHAVERIISIRKLRFIFIPSQSRFCIRERMKTSPSVVSVHELQASSGRVGTERTGDAGAVSRTEYCLLRPYLIFKCSFDVGVNQKLY